MGKFPLSAQKQKLSSLSGSRKSFNHQRRRHFIYLPLTNLGGGDVGTNGERRKVLLGEKFKICILYFT